MFRRFLLNCVPHVLILYLTVVLLTPTAEATCYTPSYYRPEKIIVPVTVPIALFSYQAAPTTPPPVTISASVLSSHQRHSDAISQELAALRVQLNQLRRERATAPAVSDGPPAVRTYRDSDGPPAIVRPGAAERNAAIIRVAQISTTRCATCHTAGGERGGVVLFDAAGTFAPQVSFRAMYDAVTRERRRMPLNAPNPLEADEKAEFRAAAEFESER